MGAYVATDYGKVRVYCDEPADQKQFFQWASASKFLKLIPHGNVTVYPQFSALTLKNAHLLELVREDRPDFIFTYDDKPILVLEVTEHGYTGDNPLQRF